LGKYPSVLLEHLAEEESMKMSKHKFCGIAMACSIAMMGTCGAMAAPVSSAAVSNPQAQTKPGKDGLDNATPRKNINPNGSGPSSPAPPPPKPLEARFIPWDVGAVSVTQWYDNGKMIQTTTYNRNVYPDGKGGGTAGPWGLPVVSQGPAPPKSGK
jgi:hypothetical protein